MPSHSSLGNKSETPSKKKKTKKHDPIICGLQETHFTYNDTHRLKTKGRRKIFHANRNHKKAGVTILKSEKIDFNAKSLKRDTGRSK